MEFRWIDWNIEHIGKHGITTTEAEWVVRRNSLMNAGQDRFIVQGQTEAGRYIQVVFLLDPDEMIFVIHARELTAREKQTFRRRSR